ncbi:2449_t:CDS:2 [Scutellospora calospora]|uniref:2449_t:CDS:1 n=1 Tax=Scutellospora calospora TaxID=85575 RepID=A0ACA9KFE0_9GLOM|nr:2449_t:CDS:2 [Scutellospora calospora]
MNSNSEAKDRHCFFAFFIKEHKDSDLLKYIEICRIITKKSFIDQLKKKANPILSLDELEKKRLKFSNDDVEPQIAKKEWSNLYEDIINIIKNQERFSLSSLLEYSPSKWLAERNPVVIKFIETLMYNENKHQHEEKSFSTVKYLLARSKMIIDMITILLAPVVIRTFDNEQKGQKNYLDHGNNTVIFHMVTSFVAFSYSQSNNIQSENSWLYTELDQKQYEELFYLSSGINPNSVANIRKVLEHIEEISGVKNSSHFPWLILIPGAFYEEMNMLKVVTSRSKLSNQHQGHNAILEEINKLLKSLIPPIPSQQYWKIAACNCTNFSKLHTNIFNIIGYSKSEANELHTLPSFTAESCQFWVQIRKTQFINPNADNCIFQNLELQRSEGSLKKLEILSIINSLIPSLGDLYRSRFRGLSNKSRKDLVNILQEVRNILAENNIRISEQ